MGVELNAQEDYLHTVLTICTMIVCLQAERLKFLHLKAYSKKFSQMTVTGMWGWAQTALCLALQQNVEWWFEKQERGRNEIQFSALVVGRLEKCWTMERNPGVRRSFLWDIIFWDGRRVLVQTAVAEQQSLGAETSDTYFSWVWKLETWDYSSGMGLVFCLLEDSHLLTVSFRAKKKKIIPVLLLFIRMHTYIGPSAYDLG